MKAIFLLFILIVSSACHKSSELTAEIIATKQKVGPGNLTRHILEKYAVGDINNDAKKDTATLAYYYIFRNDKVLIQDQNGFIDLSFSKAAPDLRIENSLGVFAEPTMDLNNDKSNEMLLFSRTDGCWNDIIVYSFTNGKWENLAHARCQFHGYPDNTERIINKNGHFYLLGDHLDKATGALMKRVVKVRVQT